MMVYKAVLPTTGCHLELLNDDGPELNSLYIILTDQNRTDEVLEYAKVMNFVDGYELESSNYDFNYFGRHTTALKFRKAV